MNTPRELFQKRKDRVRSSLKKAANGKMRLSVFRSGLHIYAQIIDDAKGVTVVSASTLEKAIRDNIKNHLQLKLPATSAKLWQSALLNPVLVKLFSTGAATFIMVA